MQIRQTTENASSTPQEDSMQIGESHITAAACSTLPSADCRNIYRQQAEIRTVGAVQGQDQAPSLWMQECRGAL